MIYATHQYDAYATEQELDEAIITKAPGFLRCSWGGGGGIVTVKQNMKNDITMSGRFEVVDEFENGIVVEDTETGVEYSIAANGYCHTKKG